MVSFEKRILRMRVLFVHLGPCYPQSPISFPSWSFEHPPWQVFIYLKIAKPNVQKLLDESNEIYTDNPMWMTLHVDLHFAACLVSTSENPSTANSVKHWKIVESSNSNWVWPCWALPRTRCSVLCSSMRSWMPLSKTLFNCFYNIGSNNPFLLYSAAPLLGSFGACSSR